MPKISDYPENTHPTGNTSYFVIETADGTQKVSLNTVLQDLYNLCGGGPFGWYFLEMIGDSTSIESEGTLEFSSGATVTYNGSDALTFAKTHSYILLGTPKYITHPDANTKIQVRISTDINMSARTTWVSQLIEPESPKTALTFTPLPAATGTALPAVHKGQTNLYVRLTVIEA